MIPRRYLTPVILSILPALSLSAPLSASEIDDLKAQMSVLMQRINKLEEKLQQGHQHHSSKHPQLAHSTHAKANAPTAVADAKNTPAPTPAEPYTRSGSDKVKLTLSGQINRAILFADDSKRNRVFHVENPTSPTIFQLNGEGSVNADTQIGANLSAEMASNPTSSINMYNQPDASSNAHFNTHSVEGYIKNVKYGQLWLGQGEPASFSATETDLSGTATVGLGPNADLIAGGLNYRTKSGGLGPKIGNTYSGMDGSGTTNRVRYDTPDYHGFSAGVSHMDGDSADAVLRYSGEIHKTQLQATVSALKQRGHYKQYTGMVSALFPNGLSLTAATGLRDIKIRGHKDAQLVYGKVGYLVDIWSLGKTAFAADMGQITSLLVNKDVARTYGIMALQNIDKVAAEVYLGLRWYHLKQRQAPSYKPIVATMLGTRIKF